MRTDSMRPSRCLISGTIWTWMAHKTSPDSDAATVMTAMITPAYSFSFSTARFTSLVCYK